MTTYIFVASFLVLSILVLCAKSQLQTGFYYTSCPAAEGIVRSTVQAHFSSDPTIAPGLLRLHFHDCFVQGCDGSVLISGLSAERTSLSNTGLRGFEVIDDAKAQLESICPGVVSCADILALAARDAVDLTGGPSWRVPLGRRDGRVSTASDASKYLPSPLETIAVQRQKFADKGLDDHDLVTLLVGGLPNTQESQTIKKKGGRKGDTSWVWEYFEKVPCPDQVVGKEVHFICSCKVCPLVGKQVIPYQWKKGTGTGTLTRHLDKHELSAENHKSGGGKEKQPTISGYASSMPGGGKPFFYNRNNMIDNMAKYVCMSEKPFTYGDSEELEEFVKLSLQPLYYKVSRKTLKKRTQMQYDLARKELIAFFSSYDNRVCLTSDCWTSRQGEPYLCITVHWIGNDFKLEKRIIAFDLMEERHTGKNIFTRINNTITEFKLSNKIMSISFDNASSNTKAIEYVKSQVNLLLKGELVHIRCCAHIVNLSAQEGIKLLDPLLDPIRSVIKWIRNGMNFRREYVDLCKSLGLRSKKWSLDTPTRWSSTYKMLKDAIRYKNVITPLYNEHEGCNDDVILIDDSMWLLAQYVCCLLKAYKDATKVFSQVYIPNVHCVILQCCGIVDAMKDCEIVPCLKPVIEKMKKKWLEYFIKFPTIYCVGLIFDPCVKASGLKDMLDFYYSTLGYSYNSQPDVDYALNVVYQLYAIYENEVLGESGPSSKKSKMPSNTIFDHPLASKIFKNKQSSSSTSSSTAYTINEYLNYDHRSGGGKQPDTLTWWKIHSAQFPVLSKIARDILVVPASTIASESAFSAGRRVLDEKRSSLDPKTVKMCVCKKDWDQAEKRRQGDKDEKDDSDTDELLTTDASSVAENQDDTDQDY